MFSPAAAGEYVVTLVATNVLENRSVTTTSFEVTGESFITPPLLPPAIADPQPQPSDPPVNPEPVQLLSQNPSLLIPLIRLLNFQHHPNQRSQTTPTNLCRRHR